MNHDPIEQDLRDGLTPDQQTIDNVVNGVMDRLPERKRRRWPRAWAALLIAGLGIATLLSSLDRRVIEIPDLLPNVHAATAAPVVRAEVGWDEEKDEPLFLPLEIVTCDIHVRATGPFAETSVTLTFKNNHDRRIEGDFVFPLPPDAVATGYALDIEGSLRDGVVVEKHRARQVFENLVSAMIDPGILEYLQGNKFRTRIFPFMPNGGMRTVRVDFVQQLSAGDSTDRYSLPLAITETIDRASLTVEVSGSDGRATGTGLGRPLDFTKSKGTQVARLDLSGTKLDGAIRFDIPSAEAGQLIVEKAPDGFYYFCKRRVFPGDVDIEFSRPKHIVLYWDSSGSRGQSDIEAELNFLRRLVAHWDNTVSVDLYRFRHGVAEVKLVECPNGDAMPLVRELQRTVYDGGSSIMTVLGHDPKVDVPVFVFTDGQNNVDRGEDYRVTRPLNFISSGRDVNSALMAHLADEKGGVHLHLERGNLAAAARTLAAVPVRASLQKISGGNAYPGNGSRIFAGTTFVGRTSNLSNPVLELKGADWSRKSTVDLKGAEVRGGAVLQKIYARRHINSLIARPETNRKALTEAGTRFGIVTPGTSMLVLETLDQYLDYAIEPPASDPELRDEYLEEIEDHVPSWRARELDREEDREEALEYCREIMLDHLEWYEQEITVDPDYHIDNHGLVENMTPGYRPGGVVPTGEAGENEISFTAEEEGGGGISIEESSSESDGMDDGESAAAEPVLPWNPNAPYLVEMKASEDPYAVYVRLKPTYGDTPSFHLDCGEFFLKRKMTDHAYRCFFNIAETGNDRVEFLRVLAFKFKQIGDYANAVTFFKKILDMRPDVSRSHMELAVALSESGEDPRAAIAHVEKILTENFSDQDDELTRILAVKEYGRLLARAREAGLSPTPVASELDRVLASDIRVVLRWDMPETDIDLWVVEPTGERCWYGNDETRIGGILPMDVTFGDGPEEYALRRAVDGVYTIAMEYWGSGSSKAMGPVTIFVDAYTNWGRPNEQKKTYGLRLEGAGDVFKIAEIEFKDGQPEIRPIIGKPVKPGETVIKRRFSDEGYVSQEIPFRDGRANGIMKSYNADWHEDENGNDIVKPYLSTTAEVVSGKRHGQELYYDVNGTLVGEFHYVNGRTHGIARWYEPVTRDVTALSNITTYDMDRMMGSVSFFVDKNGASIVRELNERSDPGSHKMIQFHDPAVCNGQRKISRITHTTRDQSMGRVTSTTHRFFPDGKLLSEFSSSNRRVLNVYDHDGVLHSRWSTEKGLRIVDFVDRSGALKARVKSQHLFNLGEYGMICRGQIVFPGVSGDRTVTLRHPQQPSRPWIRAEVRDGILHGRMEIWSWADYYTGEIEKIVANFSEGALHGDLVMPSLKATYHKGILLNAVYKKDIIRWFREGRNAMAPITIERLVDDSGNYRDSYRVRDKNKINKVITRQQAYHPNSVVAYVANHFNRVATQLNPDWKWKR